MMRVLLPKLLGLALVAGIAFNAGDDVEAHLFPIVSVPRSPNVYHRDYSTICWVLPLLKRRAATRQSESWTISLASDPSVRIFATPYPPERGSKPRLAKEASVGTELAVNRCFDLPMSLKGWDSLIIRGTLTYKTSSPWTVSQTIGPFEVRGE